MSTHYDAKLKARVSTDQHGKVRAISHRRGFWFSKEKTPLRVACDYLRQLAGTFGIPMADLADLEQEASFLSPQQQGVSYRRSEAKEAFDSTVLTFRQTFLNIPVWRTGLKVLVKEGPHRVVRAVDTSLRDLDAKLPSKELIERYRAFFDSIEKLRIERRDGHNESAKDESPKMPAEHTEILNGALGKATLATIARSKGRVRLIRGRFWVYRYDASRRSPGSRGATIDEVDSEPTLPLPPVDKRIRDGRDYVVAEIAFTAPSMSGSDFTWRMLVELGTGSVLLLQALVSGVNGFAFLLDPISKTNDSSLTSDQNNATLNPHRDDVVLSNLDPAVDGVVSLRGTYADVTDVHDPSVAAPTENTGTDFDYDVRTNDFAAVSAYFQVNRLFEAIEDLGFSIPTYFTKTDFPIRVDHRGMGGAINAHCAGDGVGGISHTCYGLMDTTDTTNPLGRACDPRVFWHELCGHGILYEHVDSANLGFSHSAGDGLSGIFFDPASQLTGDLRFEYVPWHPTLRRRFDRETSDGWAWGGSEDNAGYGSEEILATTHFRIYQCMGGDSSSASRREFASRMALYLILRTIQNLADMANPQYARDFCAEMEATDLLDWTSEGVDGGAYNKLVRWSFEKQGEFQDPPLERSDPAFGTVTTAGEPPEVDVYIDDGRGGEYDFLENFWKSTTVWNRLSPDGLEGHESPVLGETNYAYVKVRNRGKNTATNVKVRGYHRKPSTGLVWPGDFDPMITAEIDAGDIAGNDSEEKLVGPFEWTPENVGISHDCMLMIVTCDEDEANVENFTGAETVPHWRLVPNDNNIVQRNVSPVPASEGSESVQTATASGWTFWAKNPHRRPTTIEIDLRLPDLLVRRGWSVTVEGLGPRFELDPGEEREVTIRLTPGQPFAGDAVLGTEDRDLDVSVLADGIVVGGMTYRLDPTLSKLPTKRSRCCQKEAERLLDCLDVAPGDVKRVRVKNICLDVEMEDRNGCC